jgi:anti-sigma factor RsiW
MTNHVSEDQISSWLDHQLDPEVSLRIEKHLECCPSCGRKRAEMAAASSLFREMEALAPPVYLWTRISAGLRQMEPEPVGWVARLGVPFHQRGWLRAEILAFVATVVIACGFGISRWSAVRTERQQLAAIDRAYHSLLPQNAESFNPFATSPWVNTESNPFANGAAGSGGKSSAGSQVKR